MLETRIKIVIRRYYYIKSIFIIAQKVTQPIEPVNKFNTVKTKISFCNIAPLIILDRQFYIKSFSYFS